MSIENDNINIGLDLLMNPKKRASSGSIKSSKSGSIIRIDDERKSIKSEKRKSRMTHDSSSMSSVSSSGSDDSSSVSSTSSGSDDSSSVSSGSISSKGSSSSSSMDSLSTIKQPKKLSQDDILNMKKELLYQFDRLERKGVRVPKKFTLASSLEEMRIEYERMKKDREVDTSVKFQKRMIMMGVTGIEFLNKKFDPFDFRLDGWSESVNETIGDYDDIFEELHEKYKGKASMPPELKLMLALAGSAFMFHLNNTMFKNLPGFEQVMKQNPELMKQFAAATMNTMASNQAAQQKSQQSSGGGGLGGLMSGLMGGGGLGGIIGSLFGGGGGGPPMQSMPSPNMHRPQMRGPTDVDDILKELNQGNFKPMNGNDDRVEMLSTVSESEISDIPDDASASGVFLTKKKKGPQNSRRTLNI